MESEVFERIRDYLADQLDIEAEKITPESDIINDFGADSLDVIDAVVKEFSDLKDNEALVLMGHGTTHYANSIYAALYYTFKDKGYILCCCYGP